MLRSTGNLGFTIIEVMVSAVILGIVALIGITQIRSLSPAQTLENGVDDLRSFYVLARSYAQTGHVCCNDQLPYGYGVFFSMDGTPDAEAVLYADFDDTSDYTTTGSDVIINTLTLPRGLNFFSCEDSIAITTNPGKCDVFFMMSGAAQVYSNGANENSAIITTIEHSETSATDDVTINSYGVIE